MSTRIPVGLATKVVFFAFSVSINEAILKNDVVQISPALGCYGNLKHLA